jgi:hypothetical protein
MNRSQFGRNVSRATPLRPARIPLDPWLANDMRSYLAEVHQDADNPRPPLFPRLTRIG